MSRHDRAYGRYHAPGSKGGSQRRKGPKLALMPARAGRNDGNKPAPNSPRPQGTKPPKGGSKGDPKPKE